MFLCGRTARARSTRRHRAQPPGPATPVPAAPPLPAAHSYLRTTCVRACVRPPHQHNVQSPLSSRRCRTSTCPRPRASVLSPACASVVHMCDSVCGEIATTSSSGVPKVSTVREPPEEYRSCCCCLISRGEDLR